MIPIRQPKDKRGGASLRLVGDTCGHIIDVLVRAHGQDAKRIIAAMEGKRPFALLDRLCPFCRERRDFRFPLVDEPMPSPCNNEPMSFPSNELKPSLRVGHMDFTPPRERAFRLWEDGRRRTESDPEAACRDLKLAADIFDRQGMWVQRKGAQRDLAVAQRHAEELREVLVQSPNGQGE